MYQSRDEVRAMYLKVWQKMESSAVLEPMEALIAGVIEQHPEYHELLDKDDDLSTQEYSPEQGQTNPFLHMGMHIALREQAGADHPAGIRSIYQKLVQHSGQHAAEHAMMECLGQALWSAQRNNRPPDDGEYLECLKKL